MATVSKSNQYLLFLNGLLTFGLHNKAMFATEISFSCVSKALRRMDAALPSSGREERENYRKAEWKTVGKGKITIEGWLCF